MRYKFLGKPDDRFPFLKHGEIYKLVVKASLYINGILQPCIVYPFQCPYSSWEAFYKNWKPV